MADSMSNLIVSHPQVLLKQKRLKTSDSEVTQKKKRAKEKRQKGSFIIFHIILIPVLFISFSLVTTVHMWFLVGTMITMVTVSKIYLSYSCEGGASTFSSRRVWQSGGVCTSACTTGGHGEVCKVTRWQERDGRGLYPTYYLPLDNEEESTTSIFICVGLHAVFEKI